MVWAFGVLWVGVVSRASEWEDVPRPLQSCRAVRAARVLCVPVRVLLP